MTTPTSPGWYDDPETPDQLRYFDGIVWTRHMTPRAGLAAAPVVETATPSAPAPAHPGSPVPPATGQWPGQSGHGGQGQWPGQGGAGQHWAAGERPVGPTTRDGVPLASYRQRVGAFFIDGLIKIALNLLVGGYPLYRAFQSYFDESFAAAKAGRSTPIIADLSQLNVGWLTAYVLVTALIGIAYSVYFNTRSGATPGKAAAGISVRLVDHPGPLDLTTAVRRAALPFLVAIVASVPVVGTLALGLWLVDHTLPLAQQRRQALHDLIAGTQVVRGAQPRRR